MSDTQSARSDSIDELLLRVSAGDQVAFGELYDLVAGRVYGIIRRCLIDVAQSEEVTQDVFLEVWQHCSRFNPASGKATTWILTMAHRRAIDRVRASQSSRNRDLKTSIRDLPHDFDHVAEEVEISLDHARAVDALSRITEVQREAVTLAYFDGYTQSEIAEILHIGVGTVKTRIRDGLMHLRKELDPADSGAVLSRN